MLKFIVTIIFFVFLSPSYSLDQEYFLTLRNEKVNLRQGPSFDHPIKIFYKKKYLPVLIQDISGNFRKVRDHESNTGWIHISQLSKKKAAITIDDNELVYKKATIFSEPLVKLERGRLCLIIKCEDQWCKMKTGKYKGWIKKISMGKTLKIYFFILEAQNLSSIKYQTVLARGSTIASVSAIMKLTLATNIKTVMAIKK